MIKLAIVGTGGIAHWHAEHFQKINDVSIVAACDVDEKKLNEFNGIQRNRAFLL